MTVGELAKMVNARGWLGTRCDLTVVPMRGWERSDTWGATGLRWISTSPNIPRGTSPLYYVATGLVGELSGPEMGIGGSAPFESIAASWLKAGSFTRYLQSLDMPGVTFSEYRKGRYQGSRLRISASAPANLTALGIYMMAEMNRLGHPDLFRRSSSSKLDIFYKVYGSTMIRSQLQRGVSAGSIVASWRSNVEAFRRARAPYLMY
jgi:uncharacterized protein YbbC (DUF1343 family)